MLFCLEFMKLFVVLPLLGICLQAV